MPPKIYVYPEPKDPDAVLDYEIDWAARPEDGGPWLKDGDTISTSTVTVVTSGITKDSDTRVGTVVIFWLSGGTAGTLYYIRNRIVTTGGRTVDRTVGVKVAAT